MCKVALRNSLFLIFLISNNALSDWQVGGLFAYTIVDLNLPSDEEFSPTALLLQGGVDLHKYLALDVRVGTGITDGKRVNLGVERTVGINTVYGGYLKFQTGNVNMNPYILLGYTQAELELSNGSTTTDVDDSGVSYGLGIEGALSDSESINLEYVQYYDEDNITIGGIGIGITSRF